MATIKISKKVVDGLPDVTVGQAIFWDSELSGFGLRITKGSKSYICQKRIDGKTVRITIGGHGQLTPEMARREAHRILGSMALGANPIDQKREARAKAVTLQEAFDDFLESRKSLKPRTVKDYRYHMERYFKDWLATPINSVTKDMIEKRHRLVGEQHGPAQGNLSMRYLRSIFSFGAGRYENSKGESLIIENPVRRLSQIRGWFRVERKRSFLKAHELGEFLGALDKLRQEAAGSYKTTDTVPDYLELILFTGLRRNEAARLKWADVDLTARTLIILDPKNHHPLTLPLSDHIHALLTRRFENRGASEFVFSGEGEGGYLVEPKRQMKKVKTMNGLTFTIHDLRRTFATVADGLELSAYSLKRLLNHAQGGDVTAGYIGDDIERLRLPMQRIADAILRHAGRLKQADVIPIHRKATLGSAS
ncbi:MAG: integrase family protein [Nitrospinae bacterium]|nr:integrase family protein [Nitrospinota bacterium]MBF0633554.1 integrase family protein [Nitrospinota bacterium]